MSWKLTDDDGSSYTLTDETGAVIGFLKARTDEQKANARKVAVASEALALLERIAECPDCRSNHFELMGEVHRVIAKAKPLK